MYYLDMEWGNDPEQQSRELDKTRAEDLGLSGIDRHRFREQGERDCGMPSYPGLPAANHSSLTQVLGGTRSSQKGAFDALCAALGVSSEAVLARARAQGLEK